MSQLKTLITVISPLAVAAIVSSIGVLFNVWGLFVAVFVTFAWSVLYAKTSESVMEDRQRVSKGVHELAELHAKGRDVMAALASAHEGAHHQQAAAFAKWWRGVAISAIRDHVSLQASEAFEALILLDAVTGPVTTDAGGPSVSSHDGVADELDQLFFLPLEAERLRMLRLVDASRDRLVELIAVQASSLVFWGSPQPKPS
jgi:hypothetical protein